MSTTPSSPRRVSPSADKEARHGESATIAREAANEMLDSAIAIPYKTKVEYLEKREQLFSKLILIIRSAIDKGIQAWLCGEESRAAQPQGGDCHLCNLPFTNLLEHYKAAHPKPR
jgi:hypothetical protein